MSNEITNRNTAERAMKFNAASKYAEQPAPSGAIHLFSGLDSPDKGSLGYYAAVVSLQQYLGLTQDGMMGAATQNTMCSVLGGYDYIVVNGVRVAINPQNAFTITDFTEDSSFDLHRFGNFSKRKAPVDRFVLHHGGYDVHHLASVLSTDERKVSTHFGIGIDTTGSIIIAQYLDVKWSAYHCGTYNEGSVGIDFALQPGKEHASRYDLPVVNNPSSIGPKQVLEFPDEILNAAAIFLAELHRVLGVEKPMKLAPHADTPLTRASMLAEDITVHGHHHVATNGKFDVSYIWDRLVAIAADIEPDTELEV